MKKKLAIICASNGNKQLVNKAKEMGVETHCFAWDKEGNNQCKGVADYFHPISVLEKEQILEKCKEINIDGVTSAFKDYAIPTVAYVAENMGLPGNRYDDMVLACGSKYTMRQVFHKHGVNSPRFAIAHDGIDLSEFKYPLIVKATDRTSSIGIIKVEKEEDLQEAIRQAQEVSFKKEVIIEEFITGSEASIDTISWSGEHHILVIKERVMAMVNNAPQKMAVHFPYELPADVQDKIIIETKKALNSINYRYGASNTEFKITDTGEVYAIEVNPRMAGGTSHILLKLHNGYDIIKGLIDVALGQFEKPVFTHKKYAGDYVCRENTENIRQIIENKGSDPDIIEAKLYKEEFLGRIGHFIYQSDRKRRW
jgi:biotin carboxylase